MDDEIKWNQKKKADRDKEIARTKAKQAVGKVYADWKARLLAKKKLKLEDLPKFGAGLRLAVAAAIEANGLTDDPFGQQSLKLVEDKIEDIGAALRAGQVLARQTPFINHLTRFLPDRPDQQPQTPEVYEFRTEAELMAIPFIKGMTAMKDWIGLTREGNKLFAWYDPDELVLVGAITSRVGVEKLPTVQEVRDAKFVRKQRN